jgi:hypothetical protein
MAMAFHHKTVVITGAMLAIDGRHSIGTYEPDATGAATP